MRIDWEAVVQTVWSEVWNDFTPEERARAIRVVRTMRFTGRVLSDNGFVVEADGKDKP